MKAETIEKIFNFLKEKEGKEIPKKWEDILARYKEKKELIRVLENHPDGIQYRHNGNLILSRLNIKLPNDLYVNGGLYLGSLPIKELPNNLHVTYELSLFNCKQITELPNNLHVEGDLIIHGTNITEIPNNLYVGGNLFIFNTPIEKKYTDKEIYRLVASTGGELIGKIFR